MDAAKNRAAIHGVPGEQARARGVLRAFLPLMGVVFLAGLLLGLAAPRIPPFFVGIGLLVVGALLFWNVRDGLRHVNAFFKGARGEERVAFLLEALPAGYHLFHDFSCARRETIDHVVVGPRGIFVVETKCWGGRVTCQEGALLVNGVDPSRPPIEQAKKSASLVDAFCAKHVSSALACTAVVCFASNTLEQGYLVVDGVAICNASELTAVILGQTECVSTDDCERIVKMMEQKKA
jgi:hypothetical protein